MEIPRLNGVIKALESGKPAFAPFSSAEIGAAQTIGGAPFDGVVFEMEHNPYDIKALRDCMQYMLNRRQIATSGSIAPAVTPMVRIPPNGGEQAQWIAKQVLDIGVYWILLAVDRIGFVVEAEISDDVRARRIGSTDLGFAVQKTIQLIKICGLGYVGGNDLIILAGLGDAVHLNGEQHRNAFAIQLSRQRNGLGSTPAVSV